MTCSECGCHLFADASKARGVCEECARGEDAVAAFDGCDAEEQLDRAFQEHDAAHTTEENAQ